MARALLDALEDAARALGYQKVAPRHRARSRCTGFALYRSAGYVEVPPYNDNPFACFWGEKRLE